MADVDSTITLWSTTASSNKPTGATTIGTGLDDNLRTIQSAIRAALYNQGSDIASASTTDLSAAATEGLYHNITGTTTITSFGTLPAGAWKILKFAGALTLTHNATSLILPGAANITTVAGDVAVFVSEGSGNWRCVAYAGQNANNLRVFAGDGTAGAPAVTFTSDPDTGMYRIGANNVGIAVNGVNALDISTTKVQAVNGYAKFSNTGAAYSAAGPYHELVNNNNSTIATIVNTNATLNSTICGLNLYYQNGAPNSTVACFMYNEDTGGLRSSLRSNGGLANYSANNVNLSDERLKKDIVDAPSYYEKWKQIKFRTFLYKDQTDSELNLGVIAQELEAVCPELISNDGFGESPTGEAPLKTVYQTDFQYATGKALQEAIARIEQLEARLAVLEAK